MTRAIDDWHALTASVARHPRVAELGRDASEQQRVETFARDLAAWLAGAPRRRLAPLARVVTAVGGRGLRDARAVSLGVPILAIEAGARATALFWPWLRDAYEPPPPDPAGSAPGEGGEGGEGSDGEAGAGSAGAGEAGAVLGAPGDGEASGDAGAGVEPGPDERDEAPADPLSDARDVLRALAESSDVDDPDLDALAARLAAHGDPEAAASEALTPVGDAAWEEAQAAGDVARTLSSLVPGVGWGHAPGELHTTLAAKLERLVALLDALPELRQLVERLGRVEADDARRGAGAGGSEEVSGVHLGGEVRVALPSELALLGDAETEDLFYQRLLERRLVSFELAGGGLDGVADPRSRGPVLAAVDTSGSMAGAREAAAKALVLAIRQRVLPQGRTVHLLLFGARGEATELRLRRGRGGLERLLDFLALGFDGGTDFDTPLVRALELLEEEDLAAADVVVITDGYARAGDDVIEAVQQARQTRGVRVFGVVLHRTGVEGVAPFSDEVWTVDPEGDEDLRLTRRRGGPTSPGL